MIDSVVEAMHLSEDALADAVLQGDTPLDTIVNSLVDQFNEYIQSGRPPSDRENYLDKMNQSIQLSEQMREQSVEEWQLDDGMINRMKEVFHDCVMDLFETLELDLYQVHDPDRLGYLLYTNFLLTDQRQSFFNYMLDKQVHAESLESEVAIAHGEMMDGNPKKMYYLAANELCDHPEAYLEGFLQYAGLGELGEWIVTGELPYSALLSFLRIGDNLNVMFLEYYQQSLSQAT